VSTYPAANPATVAQLGYDAMLAEELLVINEYALSFRFQWIIPMLPRRRVLEMVDQSHTKMDTK
jgi:hypothetical protein